MSRFELKPYTFMSLLDAVFSIYRRYFAVFFWVAAAFYILPFLAQELVNIKYMGPENIVTRMFEMMKPLTAQTPESNVAEWQKWRDIALYTIPLSFLFMIIVPLSQGPIINVIHQNTFGNRCGFREAFRIGRAKYFNLFLSFMLMNIIFVVIFSFLAVPAILFTVIGSFTFILACGLFALLGPPVLAVFLYVMILFSLNSQGIVLEGRGPLEALSRSARLIRGNWWRAFGIFFCIQIITSLIYSFSEFAFSSLNDFIVSINLNYEIFGYATVAAGLTVVQIFTTPILILGQTILFYDLKVRREAYDLEMMIRAF
jgi:hypothetical protein